MLVRRVCCGRACACVCVHERLNWKSCWAEWDVFYADITERLRLLIVVRLLVVVVRQLQRLVEVLLVLWSRCGRRRRRRWWRRRRRRLVNVIARGAGKECELARAGSHRRLMKWHLGFVIFGDALPFFRRSICYRKKTVQCDFWGLRK